MTLIAFSSADLLDRSRHSTGTGEPEAFHPSERRLVSMIVTYLGPALSRALECEAEHSLLYSADRMVGEMLPEHIAEQVRATWRPREACRSRATSQRDALAR